MSFCLFDFQRKRKDLNGKWEAQYVTMDTTFMVHTHRLLTLKGTVPLSNSTVHILDSLESRKAHNVTKTEASQYGGHLLALVSSTLSNSLVLSAPTKALRDRWVHALRWVVQSSNKITTEGTTLHSLTSRSTRGRRKSITEMALQEVRAVLNFLYSLFTIIYY